MGKERAGKVTHMGRQDLRRTLGVFDLSGIGYGDLGSSIYYALGLTALYALGATPIALMLAGLVFICTALTYAEMTSALHDSGGSASFARHAFNDIVSFVAGWGLLLDYIVTIAISAFAVSPYLSYFFPMLRDVPFQIGFSIALIVMLLLINCFGAKQSTRFTLFLVGFALITQTIIIVIGMGWLFDFGEVWSRMQINVAGAEWSPTWQQFWKGTAMAMVAYTGIESIAQLGSEARKPEKTVPRAILFVMGVLLIMYLGIAAVALSALSPTELGQTYMQDPLAGIVAALPFGSKVLGPWIGLLAAAILLSAANAGLVGASRLSFNMGEYYQLPRFFYKVHPRFRTPHVALIFFAVLASLIVVASRGQMTFLADLYNFGAMIAFFSAHLSVIVMRVRQPKLARPFKIPLNIRIRGYQIPISAIIGCIATLSVWVLVVITKPYGRYLGFAWVGVGLLFFLLLRKRERLTATGQLRVERVEIPDFNPMEIKNILVANQRINETETVQMACEIAKMHDAKVTAIHVLLVPMSMPLDAALLDEMKIAEQILQRAEAIGREHSVEIEIRIVRARTYEDAILSILREEPHDLLVLETLKRGLFARGNIVSASEEHILREAPCRVWVCTSVTPNGSAQSALPPPPASRG